MKSDKLEVVFLGTAAQLRSVAAVTVVDVTGSTTGRVATEDNRCYHRLTPTFRHPREKRRQGVQLPQSHPAPRRRRSDIRVQYSRHQIRLLQRPSVRRT